MHRAFLWLGPPLLAAGIFLFALTGDFRAQEAQPGVKETDQQRINQTVRDFLYTVTEKGVAVYNIKRDYAGCARIYGQALLAVLPLLENHPELQQAINEGLVSARQNAVAWQEAMALRKVIDRVRTQLRSSAAPGQIDKGFGPDVKPARDVVKDFKLVDKVQVDVAKPRDRDKIIIDAAKPRDKDKVIIDVVKPRDKDKVRPRDKDRPSLDRTGIVVDKAPADRRPADKDKVRADRKSTDKTKTDVVPKDKGPNPNDATISGRVTYKGQPLSSGFVTLVAQDGRKFSASIKANGSYRFLGVAVPPGIYRVAIENSVTLGKGQPRGVAIPQRYQNPQTSGLTASFNRGPNVFDISLRD